MSGERINEFKKRLIGIIQSEEQREKGLKNNEQSVGDVWDTIKRYSIETGMISNWNDRKGEARKDQEKFLKK